jgi:RNA polymerase sigma-70 factor (ECF subfamily)
MEECPRAVTEERDLIGLAQSGDDDAFGRLVTLHQDEVYRTAARLVGTEDALDIAQEVFLKAHRELKRFRGKSALATWLYRMTVNYSLNYLRGIRRERERRERYGTGDSTPPPSPERAMMQQELSSQVWESIDALPDRQRAAITLHRFEGLSAAEVGLIMGLSTGAVESLLHRAKQTLLQTFREKGLGPDTVGRAQNSSASSSDSTGSNG